MSRRVGRRVAGRPWPASRPAAIAAAVAVDLVLGEPTRLHPVRAMGGFLRRLRARAGGSGPPAARRGGLGVLVGCAVSAACGVWIARVARALPDPWSVAGEALVLKPTFAASALLDAGRSVRGALRRGDLTAARERLATHLVSRPTGDLDAGEVAGAAIESLAENLTDSVVAPLLAAAVSGPGGAYAYRFVNTADAMLGYRTPELIDLGRVPARADDVLNWIPARVAAALITLAATVADGSAGEAATTVLRDGRRTASPNAGRTMAAMAGALGVRLEKRGRYVLNAGGREPTADDIDRALRVTLAAALVAAGAAAALARISGGRS